MFSQIQITQHRPMPTEIETRAWRAQYFADEATRLEKKAAGLIAEAKGLRERAARLNPTASPS